jgi:hypothetical protein
VQSPSQERPRKENFLFQMDDISYWMSYWMSLFGVRDFRLSVIINASFVFHTFFALILCSSIYILVFQKYAEWKSFAHGILVSVHMSH